ncbi:MAG: sensor histidine kinase [Anaerolineae bacterium]
MLADVIRLTQVLSNLVENAAKFAPEGTRIAIVAHRQDGMMQFDVCDQGAGIPSGQETAIFEAVRQGHQRVRQGAGIGLAVVRGIVEAHGGSVWAANREQGGAKFSFTLPLKGS